MIHELKTLPEFFEAIISGKKKFEIRRADRPFHEGDLLALNEYDSALKCWTGRSCIVRIDYILDDKEYCKSGYITMSFTPMQVAPYRYDFVKNPLAGEHGIPLATFADTND